jgi:HEAT repeat protein
MRDRYRDPLTMSSEASENTSLSSPIARLQSWIRRALPALDGGPGNPASGTSATSETQALTDLQSENPHCRWESAAILGRSPHRSRETIAALVGALGDPEEFVRWQAARALAAQEAANVFPALADALNDKEPLRRAGAAEAMGYQGGEAASVTLCKHLDDPDASVRVAVVQGLRDLADPSTVPCLLPYLTDNDADVRRAVAGALGRIGSPAAAKSLADALSQGGQPVLVRRALAAALIRTAHPEAQPTLLAVLFPGPERDPDPQVRGYAAEALGQIGDEAAYAALSAASSDEGALLKGTVGDRARQALAALERRGRQAHQG